MKKYFGFARVVWQQMRHTQTPQYEHKHVLYIRYVLHPMYTDNHHVCTQIQFGASVCTAKLKPVQNKRHSLQPVIEVRNTQGMNNLGTFLCVSGCVRTD